MSQYPSKYLRAQTFTATSKTLTEITSYGMNDVVAKRGNPHKWAVEFQTTPLWGDDARELQAFLDTLDGRYNTFTLPSPLRFLGSSTSFVVGSSAEKGDNQVSVTGLSPNDTNALRAGDFINLGNHDKVYKIVSSTGSDSSGVALMNIHPRLFESVTAGVTVSEATFTLRMTKDDLSLGLDATKGRESVLISTIEA